METPPLNTTKLASTTWKIRDNGREFESKWEEAIEQILEGEIGYFRVFTMKAVEGGFQFRRNLNFSLHYPFLHSLSLEIN